jgi:NAD(P)-dependent dehydrogenase (short-subunit alcohol dehydrogenase family)
VSAARRTALVTGGTDGIGKAIAARLASDGHRGLVVGRDATKAARVEAELRERTGNADVHALVADLTLVREAVRLAREVCARAPALHYLVHSAGIVRGRYVVSEEGIESNFAVNYVARFALTSRLLPALSAGSVPGASSRILIVSGAARGGTIHFEDPNLSRSFGTVRAVSQFCQANDVFAIELARRLQAEPLGPTITCLKIGVVRTGIRREFPLWMRVLVPLLMDPLLAMEPDAAAARAHALLTQPGYEGVTGRHFLLIKRFQPVVLDAAALDPETGRRLWDLSERLVAAVLRSTAAPSTEDASGGAVRVAS